MNKVLFEFKTINAMKNKNDNVITIKVITIIK